MPPASGGRYRDRYALERSTRSIDPPRGVSEVLTVAAPCGRLLRQRTAGAGDARGASRKRGAWIGDPEAFGVGTSDATGALFPSVGEPRAEPPSQRILTSPERIGEGGGRRRARQDSNLGPSA